LTKTPGAFILRASQWNFFVADGIFEGCALKKERKGDKMRQEISLAETRVNNRWGRPQVVRPGDQVRLAPLHVKKSTTGTGDEKDFVAFLMQGLDPDKLYTVLRIGQFPDDETVILYLDIGQGRQEAYYAEYFQAVDQRKIKAVEFPFRNQKKVVEHLKSITQKSSRVICRKDKQDVRISEEVQSENKWIILPATEGVCQVTMEGEPRDIKLNPEKVIVIPVPAGKKHSVRPISGFSSYMVLCENGH
jgi:hypothetical protein